MGGGLTIWSGSAFDCSAKSNHIILSHSQFQEGVHGECNNGDLAAKSIGVMNGECFSSQLNITVNTRMKNKTIECIHDTAGSTENLIGSEVLAFTTGIYTSHNDNTSHSYTDLWKSVYSDNYGKRILSSQLWESVI